MVNEISTNNERHLFKFLIILLLYLVVSDCEGESPIYGMDWFKG